MNEFGSKIIVPADDAVFIKKALSEVPSDFEHCFREARAYTAVFEDGIEMEVKLCSVDYEEGEPNRPYTEAVLFDHGHEVNCAEPDDVFFKEWVIRYNDKTYVAEVVQG